MVYAVIGAGMIGSAAARHLAEAGHDVILIGPSEPDDKSKHTGAFASHYDAGRITRGLATDPFWAQASLASIARYRQIEADSGISFYNDVGCLLAGPKDAKHLQDVGRVAKDLRIDARHLSQKDMQDRFPFFAFSEDDIGYFEAKNAGTINPRALVAAQIKQAVAHGAKMVRTEAKALHETASGLVIETTSGDIKADQVLIATGGFAPNLIADLNLRVYARTVALFEVSEAEAQRLHNCPSMIYLDQDGNDPYLLPPIRYPDGKVYLKLGGDPDDQHLAPHEMTEWFQSGGNPDVGAHLEAQMRARMPDLEIDSMTTNACVTTFTDTGRPMIRRHSDRISLAVAGCGAGAKCSDQLGRLGAATLLGRELPAWASQ